MSEESEMDIKQERAGVKGLKPIAGQGGQEQPGSYDATQDPRTGPAPTPSQAQQLAQERTQPGSDEEDGSVIEGQAPARMASPKMDENEKTAIDALVQEGVTRERAEALVEEHGPSWERLKAVAFPVDVPSTSNGE